MSGRRTRGPAAAFCGTLLAALRLLVPDGARAEPVVVKLTPMMTGRSPGREWTACAADIRRDTESRVSVEWGSPTEDSAGSRERLAPLLVYGLPLRIRSFEEFDRVRERVEGRIEAQLAAGGMVLLGLEQNGFAYILSSGAIRSPADLESARVWAPAAAGNGSGAAFRPLAPKAVPLAIADVREALRQGKIDTVVFPPLGAIVLRWHTGLRHVLNMPFACLSNPIVAESTVFSALSPADRQSVRRAVQATLREINQKARAKHGEALDVLRMQGVEFDTLASEESARWEAWAADQTRRLVETGRIDRATVNLMDGVLEECRKGITGNLETK